MQLGDHPSFTLGLSSVYLSDSIENPVHEMKVDDGRIKGSLKMPPKEVFTGKSLSFSAVVEGVIITPATRITGQKE